MNKKIIPFLLSAILLSSQVPAFAASYDIKQMTPAIEKALENRKARYADLQELKNQGAIGENNQGLTEVRKSSAKAQQITAAENQDRMVIYQAIVDQNNLGAQGLAPVQKVFAEVQREKASSGQAIQLASGAWTEK